MHGEERLFQDPRTWVAIAFVVFFALFGKKLWGPLAAILDKRAETIRAELAEAQRLRGEAEVMLRDAKTQREAALGQAKQLLEGAHKEAARLAAAAAAEAEASAARRERMVLERISAAERAAVDEVRMRAADIASAAARQVIGESLTQDTGASLVDKAIAELPAALAAKKAA